jgi:hypothetical protein
MSPSPSGPGFWTLARTRAGPEMSGARRPGSPAAQPEANLKLPLIETAEGTAWIANCCR